MESLVKSKNTQKHQKHSRKYTPMLCSLSHHDDHHTNHPLSPRHHSTSSSSVSTSSEDPSSPRVGCMGQLKTTKDQNITGGRTDHHRSSNCDRCSTTNMVKYLNFRLIGLLLGGTHKGKTGKVRNICINIQKDAQMEQQHVHPPRYSTGSRIVVCRCSIDNSGETVKNEKSYCRVNLDEMDQPLPVAKRAPRVAEEGKSSLWMRRSGGVPLKSIQICQVVTQKKDQLVL